MDYECRVGDKVLIVNKRTTYMNSMGEMDKWLGTIMTIRDEKRHQRFKMKEDEGKWFWGLEMIKCLANCMPYQEV